MAVLFSIAVGALIVVATTIHQRDQEQIEQQSRALAESEQRFRTVVTSAEEAIITADSRGTIVAWNAVRRRCSATARRTRPAGRSRC